MIARRPYYHRITEGIRVSVRPEFLPEQSLLHLSHYLFAYHIRIENVGSAAAQLLRRHWHIHDDAAGDSEVEGDGVVGEQPRVTPGTSHEYTSFCVLKSPTGWMEGKYHFVRDSGEEFEVVIPRFILNALSNTLEE